jgi:hypothetical protein
MPLDTRLPLLAGQFKPITYQAPSQANMLAEVAQAASAMQGLQRNAMAMREARQRQTAVSNASELLRQAQAQGETPESLLQHASVLEQSGVSEFVMQGSRIRQAVFEATRSKQESQRPFEVSGRLVSPEGRILFEPPPAEDKGIVVGGRLVNPRTGQVVFEPPAEPRAPMAVGSRIVDPNTGKVIFEPPAEPARPMAVGNRLVNPQTGQVVFEPPAEPTKPVAVGNRLVNPQTGEVVFEPPPDAGRPVVVGNALVDPSTGGVIYERPQQTNTAPIPDSVNLGNRVVIFDKNPNSATFGQELRSMEVGAKPEAVRPPSTAPEPKQVQLGDRVVTIDNNPNSATFGRELGSLQMGAGPMTQAQVEANRLADARLALETARVNNDRAGVQQAERRLRILEQEASQRADPAFQARMAAAQAAGTATGRAQVEKASQANEIAGVISELEQAVKPGGLIDRSTGSGAGALADVAAGFVGIGTPGAVAIGRLQPIADMVLKIIPRFEGPQSDKDTASYKEAAGKLADPATPNNIRRAAANEILRILRDRKGRLGSSVVSFDSAAAASAAPAAAPSGPAAPRALAAPATAPAQGNRREIAPGVFVTERP